MDIQGFFDEVSHELLLKALDKHVAENWVKMYIVRWLESPIEQENGCVLYRTGKGTPQGGVISPLLANLYLHYAFDKWMEQTHKGLNFVRYADDIIVHCRTKRESMYLLNSIQARMNDCHLRLHEVKTQIVFCKKSNRASTHDKIQFDFLGYCFRPRTTKSKRGTLFLSFDCAISKVSLKKLGKELRSTKFHNWTGKSIEQLAEYFNPRLQGWINYYGKFRLRNLDKICKLFNRRLAKWAKNRFKRLKNSYVKASKWLREYKAIAPELFTHWRYGFINA